MKNINTHRSPAARRAFALVRAAFRRGGNTADNLHEMDAQDLRDAYGLTDDEAESLRQEVRALEAQPDAWQSLVLHSMSVDELRREMANTENTDRERAMMRAELKKKENTK